MFKNDREKPLTVEKKLTPKLDRNKIHLNVKGSSTFYAVNAVLLSGVQGGKYHLYEDVTGNLSISRAYSDRTKHDQSKSVERIRKIESKQE